MPFPPGWSENVAVASQVEPGLKSCMSKFLGTLEYPYLFLEMSKLTCKL